MLSLSKKKQLSCGVGRSGVGRRGVERANLKWSIKQFKSVKDQILNLNFKPKLIYPTNTLEDQRAHFVIKLYSTTGK